MVGVVAGVFGIFDRYPKEFFACALRLKLSMNPLPYGFLITLHCQRPFDLELLWHPFRGGKSRRAFFRSSSREATLYDIFHRGVAEYVNEASYERLKLILYRRRTLHDQSIIQQSQQGIVLGGHAPIGMVGLGWRPTRIRSVTP
jgi:hypothetical protein